MAVRFFAQFFNRLFAPWACTRRLFCRFQRIRPSRQHLWPLMREVRAAICRSIYFVIVWESPLLTKRIFPLLRWAPCSNHLMGLLSLSCVQSRVQWIRLNLYFYIAVMIRLWIIIFGVTVLLTEISLAVIAWRVCRLGFESFFRLNWSDHKIVGSWSKRVSGRARGMTWHVIGRFSVFTHLFIIWNYK